MSAPPFRPVLVALLALAVVGATACGGGDRQAKLSKAIKARAEAREHLEDAHKALSKAEARLAEAQTARDQAAKSVQGAERALSEAEAKVGLYATDDELFRHIQKLLLEDRDLKDAAISASVKSGVVTLSGHVPDARARDHAIELARGVPGVVNVKSELVIPSEKGAGNGSAG